MRKATALAVLALAVLPATAWAVPCGRDRCTLFRAAAGLNGKVVLWDVE